MNTINKKHNLKIKPLKTNSILKHYQNAELKLAKLNERLLSFAIYYGLQHSDINDYKRLQANRNEYHKFQFQSVQVKRVLQILKEESLPTLLFTMSQRALNTAFSKDLKSLLAKHNFDRFCSRVVNKYPIQVRISKLYSRIHFEAHTNG